MQKLLLVMALPVNVQASDRLMFGINPCAFGSEDQWMLKDSFQPLADYIARAV